jgi:hypothetical protein
MALDTDADADENVFDPRRKLVAGYIDLKDLCASLVEIESDQTVTLVHSTAKG